MTRRTMRMTAIILLVATVAAPLASRLRQRARRTRDALAERTGELSEATEIARSIGAIEARFADLERRAREATGFSLATWARERVAVHAPPADTMTDPVHALGVEEVRPGLQRERVRIELPGIDLETVFAVLYDLDTAPAPTGVELLDLSPSATPSRFDLAVEAASFLYPGPGGPAATPGRLTPTTPERSIPR